MLRVPTVGERVICSEDPLLHGAMRVVEVRAVIGRYGQRRPVVCERTDGSRDVFMVGELDVLTVTPI